MSELWETGERTWLYIIAEDTAPDAPRDLVKIGFSNKPFKRLDTLQAGCPTGCLYIVRAFGFKDRAYVQSIEKHFHGWLKNDQCHREWFWIAPDWAVELVRRHICLTMREESDADYEEFKRILWADTEDEFTDLGSFE